ncbi:MAG: glyoxylase-like metal-dependent hydrolase (beta-lactamase superfamily II) [Pseudohongiellaceae bacterium]|jgi:glyoxylase-like metal-dependent hydrolase (beta-lactamase superfamily II)
MAMARELQYSGQIVSKKSSVIIMQASDVFPASSSSQPKVFHFFEEDTNTFSYVVQDPTSKACAIIDSVLNFDMASGRATYASADEIVKFVQDNQLEVQWIIETHVHADHLSAAPYLKQLLGGKIAIGEHVATVQETFGTIFNADADFAKDGSQFDHLFKDEEQYSIGSLVARAIHTPGHTPACMVHIIGDAAFVGDTLFMPDAGTARADFPGGNAAQLFDSIQKIMQLPGETKVFMCHDYGAEGRGVANETTVAAEIEKNIHVNCTVEQSQFVAMREARDKTLDVPHLILPSLQVNMRAGHFPKADSNGTVYLKVPVNIL